MSSDGYTGFNDEQETVLLTASSVARIHREGGTVLRSARGGFDAKRITAFLISRGITQLYVLGELCLFPSLRVSFITVTVCLYCLTSLRIDIHNRCADHVYPFLLLSCAMTGGDGTHRGAHLLYEELAEQKIPIAIVAIPKTIGKCSEL